MRIIKKTREELGYTQQELAKKTGLSLRTIQRLEAKNKEPKGHTLGVLSTAFQMSPAMLQQQFRSIAATKTSEITTIRLINLSTLACLGIPFGNLIFPFILWRKNRDSNFVDEMGRRILNFQIIWTLVLSILLCISPFVGRALFSNVPLILWVLLLAYSFNIVIICSIAMKLQRHDFQFLDFSFRLI